MQVLTQQATKRLSSAYKPKTWQAYKVMFTTFMAFCEFTSASFLDPKETTVIAFLEFLCFNDLRFSSIQNYIVAIKSQMKWFKLPTQVFEHSRVKLMLKAVKQTYKKTLFSKECLMFKLLSILYGYVSCYHSQLCIKHYIC